MRIDSALSRSAVESGYGVGGRGKAMIWPMGDLLDTHVVWLI
jgi:hypothetical protein